MTISRLESWGYFCKGQIPITIKKHTITIDEWTLAINGMEDIKMPATIIDFVVDKHPVDFTIYIEPPGDYIVIEEDDDGFPKEAAEHYIGLWRDQFVLLMLTGRAEKKKDLKITVLIEEFPNA